MDKVEAFLQHYQSQYYDPAKAHEYYMKNRQLKGRSTSGMSQEQREAWGYAKDKITTEKKTKITMQDEVKKRQIEQFRARAEATRKRISDKLQRLNEVLTKKAESERDAIQDIPKGISPEKRAELIEKRKEKLADIREDTKSKKTDAKNEASSEREKTRTELKSAISTARETYKKAKESIKANYEKVYQNEYDKILSNVKGKKKSKRRKK